MFELVTNIKKAAHHHTTYRVGLLQAKAYRALKSHTSECLRPHHLSTVEWAFLGILFDAPMGMRASAAGKELGVEAPFITTLAQKCKGKGWIELIADDADRRARIVHMTEAGNAFVKKIEREVRTHMKPLIEGVSARDLVSYINVLMRIVENDGK